MAEPMDRDGVSDGATEWQFLQCFGERTPGEEIQDADIISTVCFDGDGEHLATGDRGGRVVLFERIAAEKKLSTVEDVAPQAQMHPHEYRYLTEFQSHEPEFDYLKSLEIEEKINKVRWGLGEAGGRLLLSTNDKTVRLWRVYERTVRHLGHFNIAPEIRATVTSAAQLKKMGLQCPTVLRLPKVLRVEVQLTAKCKRVFANAHTYHINSISPNSDGETFISADDLRVNLWNYEHADKSFNIVDIKPDNMEDLTEVITSADFHPHHCHQLVYSSSKGCIRMVDMRAAALCDKHQRDFVEQEEQPSRSFFSEIISSVSDVKFSKDGRYLVSRDYMTVKLWDVNMEARPLKTFLVHEPLRAKLCDLYENDCIFDKFECCISGQSTHVATGSYGSFFRVFSCDDGPDHLLESSRDPQRKRVNNAKGASGKKKGAPPDRRLAGLESLTLGDFGAKMLHLAWHPRHNIIASAASNSLYLFCTAPC
ncbi:unnamed protein product [Pedinophyceae sp. YPF-701]|nr:unnamed protein product [Pedinophyceae sp. YPF-701]